MMTCSWFPHGEIEDENWKKSCSNIQRVYCLEDTNVKLEHAIIICMGILVAVVTALILAESDEIPHWSYLQKMKQQEFEDGCDIICKENQESKRGYVCVPLDSEQYICRPPRDIFYPDEDIQVRTVFPPTYGEFAYIPENHEMVERNRLFDISNVILLDEESKEIMVEFEHHLTEDAENYFQYSSTLYPGDTFVSHCFGGDSKMAHAVEYRDLINIEEKRYFEFWGTHVDLPDELLPCNMPELIQHSLPVDLRLGINFGEENEDTSLR